MSGKKLEMPLLIWSSAYSVIWCSFSTIPYLSQGKKR